MEGVGAATAAISIDSESTDGDRSWNEHLDRKAIAFGGVVSVKRDVFT